MKNHFDSSKTEILGEEFVNLIAPSKDPKNFYHKKLEDTIELLATGTFNFHFDDEEIEVLEEEVEDFKRPSFYLEDTIELLDITVPLEPLLVKKKIIPKKRPWIVLFALCFIVLCAIGFKAFFWGQDNLKTNRIIGSIIESTKVEESTFTSSLLSQEENNNLANFQYFNVDFTNLLKENEETKGWIKVNNTNINYPFVQGVDNDFYLTHSFDKSKNSAGWVFADFRNHFDKLDQNTILYAHGRLDNTMFGSLKQVIDESWYKEKENQFVHISLLNQNTIWKVFSVYIILPETYYITPNFEADEKYQEFLTTLANRSVYNFNEELSLNDKILTLSSCYNDEYRVVLHAKLIGTEERKDENEIDK